MEDNLAIRGDGNNSLELVYASSEISRKFAAQKNTIEEKDFRISSPETIIEKLEKSHQEEVTDLKNDIVDQKEKALDRETHNSKDTIIPKIPPKVNGKSVWRSWLISSVNTLTHTLYQLISKLVNFCASLTSLLLL